MAESLTTETAQKVTRAVFHQFQKPSHESSMEPRLSQRIGSLSASGEIFCHSYPFTLSYTFLHSLCKSHPFAPSFSFIHTDIQIDSLCQSPLFTQSPPFTQSHPFTLSVTSIHSIYNHSVYKSHLFTLSNPFIHWVCLHMHLTGLHSPLYPWLSERRPTNANDAVLDEIFGTSESAGDFDIDTDDVNTWIKVCGDSCLSRVHSNNFIHTRIHSFIHAFTWSQWHFPIKEFTDLHWVGLTLCQTFRLIYSYSFTSIHKGLFTSIHTG